MELVSVLAEEVKLMKTKTVIESGVCIQPMNSSSPHKKMPRSGLTGARCQQAEFTGLYHRSLGRPVARSLPLAQVASA